MKYVVGVTKGPRSRAALRWATREAACSGADVEAVTAYDVPLVWTAEDGEKPKLNPKVLRAQALSNQEQTIELALQRQSRVRKVMGRVLYGDPAEVLASASAEADLLVVGLPRDRTTLRPRPSAARTAARNVVCPVAYVKPGDARALGPQNGESLSAGLSGLSRIVVGIPADRNPTAALLWAYEHARLNHCEVEVVMVADDYEPEHVALERLHRAVTGTLGQRACEFIVGHRVRYGNQTIELADAARNADILVIPAPQKRRRFRISKAERCARLAPCAVVEVPPNWCHDNAVRGQAAPVPSRHQRTGRLVAA